MDLPACTSLELLADTSPSGLLGSTALSQGARVQNTATQWHTPFPPLPPPPHCMGCSVKWLPRSVSKLIHQTPCLSLSSFPEATPCSSLGPLRNYSSRLWPYFQKYISVWHLENLPVPGFQVWDPLTPPPCRIVIHHLSSSSFLASTAYLFPLRRSLFLGLVLPCLVILHFIQPLSSWSQSEE